MDNPFEAPVPQNVIERVHAFARDLAYGVTLGLWHTQIHWRKLLNPDISMHSKVFADYLRPKWGTDFPSEYLMLSFGYFEDHDREAGYSIYLLTQKAFELLEKPSAPPSVFISYRRQDSSAFALLVEARLRLAGNPNPFVDKNLIPGEEWNDQLKRQIQSCRYFIALIGPTTLQSPHVLQEINWAAESASTIISVWHKGAAMDDAVPQVLQSRHAITIMQENALGYETAINQLLNAMGYATY
jgi:hypothetical protein